jgi:uncharacterized membrane protein
MQNFQTGHLPKNVGKVERAVSLMAGALLLSRGLQKKNWVGTGAALLGIAFLRHGITGFCYTYQALGIDTSEPSPGPNVSVPSGKGIRIDDAITINRPRDEVYRFWRDFSNLAHFMEHVQSVHASAGSNRSHWIAKGPGGKRMEWDAEIVNESENELIAWRSLDGSEVPNAGSVHFKDASGGRGTEVKIELQYVPCGGSVGAFVARLFNEDPAQQVHNDLKRLKARLEAGFVPDTEGQPVGGRREERQPHSDAVSKASEQSFPASDSPAFSH